MKVACVHCKDFFEPQDDEVMAFIDSHADKDFLRKIPFPKELREIHKTRKRYVAFLLNAYCPYCRVVLFGQPHDHKKYPGKDIKRCSDDRFFKAIEREIEKSGAFEITQNGRPVRPVLSNDEWEFDDEEEEEE